jgi:hypothetical protein
MNHNLRGSVVTDPISVDHPIVGAWRLTSLTERNLQTGAIAFPLGESERATVIYTADGHVVTLFTSEDRKPPAMPQVTDREAADLYRSMVAFAGRYELQGSKLIYRPEISWNEAWNRTGQERLFEVSRERLEVDSAPTVSALTGTMTTFSLVWERAR